MEKFAEDFVEQYIAELKKLRKPDNLKGLYQWFWEQKDRFPEVTKQMNEDLGLKGDYEIKPGLPIIGSGKVDCFGSNRLGTLLININPAWVDGISQVENHHCNKSLEHYVRFQLGFFSEFPKEMGMPNRFWNEALEFFRLYQNWDADYGPLDQGKMWELAARKPLLGGWELFPFHSHNDGISGNIHKKNWLRTCITESANAAIRMKPKTLF